VVPVYGGARFGEPSKRLLRVRPMSAEMRQSRWSRPLVGIASVAVIGAGLGAFLGIRAVQGAGSASSAGQPQGRTGAAMVYDASSGSIVLFGGQSRFHTLNDTWTWDGSAWTEARPATAPPPLNNPQMAYDPVRHDVVLVGDQEQGAIANHVPVVCSSGSGSSSSGSAGSTTTFIPPRNPIPAIAPAPAVTPAPTSTAKASGPVNVGLPDCATIVSPVAVTWVWNGSDWSKAAGSTPDLVFGTGSLATDPVAGRVVLLPRGPFAVPALGEAQAAIACPVQSPATPHAQPKCPWPWPVTNPPAWMWNGHQWKEMASNAATTSYAFFNSPIVDDAVSGKLATFGGNVALPAPAPCSVCLGAGTAVQPSATSPGVESIWTGTVWKQVGTYSGGPAAADVAFVGDPATHSDVVLSSDGQTWLWTGHWTRAHPGTTPPIVSDAASAYDTATGQIVMFGGAGTTARKTGLYDQTWTWDGSNWTQRGGTSGPSVIIPVPNPVSVPPGLPCEPIAEPAQPAGTVAPQPTGVCGVSTGGSPGSSSGSSGGATGIASGTGVAAP